jgi:hypothetical protein
MKLKSYTSNHHKSGWILWMRSKYDPILDATSGCATARSASPCPAPGGAEWAPGIVPAPFLKYDGIERTRPLMTHVPRPPRAHRAQTASMPPLILPLSLQLDISSARQELPTFWPNHQKPKWLQGPEHSISCPALCPLRITWCVASQRDGGFHFPGPASRLHRAKWGLRTRMEQWVFRGHTLKSLVAQT